MEKKTEIIIFEREKENKRKTNKRQRDRILLCQRYNYNDNLR